MHNRAKGVPTLEQNSETDFKNYSRKSPKETEEKKKRGKKRFPSERINRISASKKGERCGKTGLKGRPRELVLSELVEKRNSERCAVKRGFKERGGPVE